MALSTRKGHRLEDLYDFLSLAKNFAPLSVDAPVQIALIHNRLVDARQDIIKLMVMKAAIDGQLTIVDNKLIAPKIVKDYIDPNDRLISASGQKEEINKFIQEIEKLKKNPKNLEQKFKNDFEQFIRSMQSIKFPKQDTQEILEDYLKATIEEMQTPVDTPEQVLLRTIQFEISDTIRQHRRLHSDAQRDFERNTDFILGNRLIDQIIPMLSTPPTNENLKELHLAMQTTILEIDSNVRKSTLKTKDQPEYKSLMALKEVLKISMKILEDMHPEIKIEKQEFNKMKKESASNTKMEIKQHQEESRVIRELQKIRMDLVKKLKKSKVENKDKLIAEIDKSFNSSIENPSERADQILKAMKSALENSGYKGQPKKLLGLNFFKKKTPQEELSTIVSHGLKTLDKADKRFSITDESRTQLPKINS